MAENHSSDFLPLPPREYPSDDDFANPIQPVLDTLFSDFSQRHRSPSPITFSSSPNLNPPRRSLLGRNEPSIDLRTLDYTTDYDSHLMCPICHIPFIDPVVLDCDHTFCAACLSEYRTGTTNNDTARCPSCRTLVLSSPKKASRLITNMCNDIKVGCPNEGCDTVLARGYIEHHVSKDCAEQLLRCPDTGCEKQTKRKNFVPNQCIHNTHIECDCGAVIELGRGKWIKHKDEDCPNTGVKCEHCSGRIPANDYFSNDRKHDCQSQLEARSCPGREFGCIDEVGSTELDGHVLICPLARLAPFLVRQNRMLNALTEQLSQSKMRNEVLETGLERINGLVANQLRSKASDIPASESEEIEEIERDHIPGTSLYHHRDLLLPAHVRDLTPSPTFSHSHSQPSHLPDPFHSPAARSTGSSTSHQHLLSLHDSLRSSITSLETDVHQLHINITELDARSSMQIMNETLRLKEELAHTNAALFSTRAQVQWLLNKERMGMGPGMSPNIMRRQSSIDQTAQTQGHVSGQAQNHGATDSSSLQPQPAADAGESSGVPNTSNHSSTTTSPTFSAASMHSRRPSVRRHSGGSQERVKL